MLQMKIKYICVFLCSFLHTKLALSQWEEIAIRTRPAYARGAFLSCPFPRYASTCMIGASEMSPFFIFFVKNGTKDDIMKYRHL
jgi:hypothetical protein